MSDQNRPPRKDRSDMRVGEHEKKHGFPPGYIRHPSGRDVRSDMKLETLRKKDQKKN
jgi:hypothetical protein